MWLNKREHKAVENSQTSLKMIAHAESQGDNNPKIWIIRDPCNYTGLYRGRTQSDYNLKYQIADHISIARLSLNGYEIYLFIKELDNKSLTRMIMDWLQI